MNKKILVFLMMLFLCPISFSSQNIVIPDLGPAGVRGLSIAAEKNFGEYFFRKANGAGIVSYDPVLNEYINSVGNRLVLHANNVYFPFHFYLSEDPSLNASAFLGGVVQVNAGLFHYTSTEDEFASVIAHEICHVTQRHIARMIEDQVEKSSLSVASIIGSIVLGIINPNVGMAALSSTTGLMQQSNINFTRDNEYEADRLGIELLYNSGFNPMGMADLFRVLLSKQGNVSSVYAMLIDHPLSDIRVAEAYNRAKLLPKRENSKNPNFMLAKARVDVRYMNLNLEALKNKLMHSQKVNHYYKYYALALIAYENNDHASALKYLSNLDSIRDNDFILDLKTDIELSQKNYKAAIEPLERMYKIKPNDSAITLNLANALVESKDYKKAIKILKNFQNTYPKNLLASELIAKSYYLSKDKCNAHQSQAYSYLLKGDFNKANRFLNNALHVCNGTSREIVRAKLKKYNDIKLFDRMFEQNI